MDTSKKDVIFQILYKIHQRIFLAIVALFLSWTQKFLWVKKNSIYSLHIHLYYNVAFLHNKFLLIIFVFIFPCNILILNIVIILDIDFYLKEYKKRNYVFFFFSHYSFHGKKNARQTSFIIDGLPRWIMGATWNRKLYN